jgi:hypothetical protein
MGWEKPAAATNSESECSGLRSPHNRYSSACCGKIGTSTARSGARSGAASDDPPPEGPREPPNPPSPRAKIDRFCVHSSVPSGLLTFVSLRITAALPLSQMSVNRVTARAEPDAGSGSGTSTAACGHASLQSRRERRPEG